MFNILNNASIRRNICLNFRKLTRENKPLFWQKWTPDVFFLFPAAMLVSLGRAPAWRLHAKLYKFVWNIMSNNSSTENRTDLRLGQSPYLFIVYNVSISWLHSLNGFWFLFWWRDSENRQLKAFHFSTSLEWRSRTELVKKVSARFLPPNSGWQANAPSKQLWWRKLLVHGALGGEGKKLASNVEARKQESWKQLLEAITFETERQQRTAL